MRTLEVMQVYSGWRSREDVMARRLTKRQDMMDDGGDGGLFAAAEGDDRNLLERVADPREWERNLNRASGVLVNFLARLLYALIVLIIGYLIVWILVKLVERFLRRRKWEPTLVEFASSMIKVVLKVAVWIMVFTILEIEVLSVTFMLGAFAFAVGTAVGGAANNFIAGALLLIFKPLKPGDWVETSGHSGAVEAVGVLTTTLITGDNKVITLPNAPIVQSSLVNYSTQPKRRVDLVFGIAYSDDIEIAKRVIENTLRQNSLVLKEPALNVQCHELGDSSVNLIARPWCKSANYWALYWQAQHDVKVALERRGLSIPFPQIDAHVVPPDEEDGVVRAPVPIEDDDDVVDNRADDSDDPDAAARGGVIDRALDAVVDGAERAATVTAGAAKTAATKTATATRQGVTASAGATTKVAAATRDGTTKAAGATAGAAGTALKSLSSAASKRTT
mmetsp:Transcript_12799/g.31616  ORF Transcript_12799/g.31616 Transcript_12799/m.31616 type:complete len:449 (-) Transcript_12799:1435-2781(-)